MERRGWSDTCCHRRVRPEKRWPPATGAAWRGGREDKAALPGQLRCLFVRRALTLGFTQTQPCWVSGHCSRKTRTRRGTRCPLSATNSKSLKPTESQPRANPAPISSMQVTDSPLLERTGARQPEECRAEACGKCSPWWEKLVRRSGVRKRGPGCEGLEASGCRLGPAGRARIYCCPLTPNVAHWAGGCVVALPGLRLPVITLSHA